MKGRGGGAAWAWCVAAVMTGCGDPAPLISLDYGTLTEDHATLDAFGCSPDERTEREHRGTTALSPSQHAVSRQLMAGVALARFDFDVSVAPAAGRAAALTLAASARVEDNRCGTGCEGAAARARFSWSGAVSLPAAAQGYAVRVSVHAERATSRGEKRFGGECAIETPWRPAIVVESGDSTRDFDAPAGEATIRVACSPTPERSLASIGCIGAPTSEPPEAQGLARWSTASLRVRFEFVPRGQ